MQYFASFINRHSTTTTRFHALIILHSRISFNEYYGSYAGRGQPGNFVAFEGTILDARPAFHRHQRATTMAHSHRLSLG
jgi:hypothetical protein